ncbi:uncharacterized protein LOC116432626 isoform X2 [Nomia melanderi]|uniref:uncharacterized protein LOC116432626 isoform X2 n=1 Tax=Nomia melanderi TaxID=2448451 RepID=UPI00130469C6|nr:uncharacterized protein LOC116432626 isoform X2 [Nomia melanderi]
MKRNAHVPRRLLEVNKLLNLINRKLEDCALEWQAEISRKQWKIFNSHTIENNLSEKSLLARTYFSEKKFDKAFQHVLFCNQTFTKYLKDFIALLQGKESAFNEKEIYDGPNQGYSITKNWNTLNGSNIESLYLPLLRNQQLNGMRKPKNPVDNTLEVQNSFADVIKAKVNFDTKFLGFEDILHKISSLSTSTDTTYICQYCSKQLKTAQTGRENIIGTQKHHIITKTKRLTRSAKQLFKKKEMNKSSFTINETDNQSSFKLNTSF